MNMTFVVWSCFYENFLKQKKQLSYEIFRRAGIVIKSMNMTFVVQSCFYENYLKHLVIKFSDGQTNLNYIVTPLLKNKDDNIYKNEALKR